VINFVLMGDFNETIGKENEVVGAMKEERRRQGRHMQDPARFAHSEMLSGGYNGQGNLLEEEYRARVHLHIMLGVVLDLVLQVWWVIEPTSTAFDLRIPSRDKETFLDVSTAAF
jgi:hypothetical protein